jgi:hypothetical protein
MYGLRQWRAVAATLITAALTACGGGGGSAGDSPFGGGDGSGSGGDGVKAANLVITLDKGVVSNSGGDVVIATITATNAGGKALAGVAVDVAVDSDAVVTVSGDQTDEQGVITATVSPGSNLTPRTVTITAAASGIQRVAAFQVSANVSTGTASLGLTLSSTTVTAVAPSTARAVVLDTQGRPVEGAIVSFSTAAGLGVFSADTALTDAFGVASVQVFPQSSNASGADLVVAKATVGSALVQAAKGFTLTATAVTVTSFTADIGAARLSPYGQTNLSVVLGGVTPGTPVSLSVTSLCVSKVKATLTPATVTTTNGTASFTYKDNGCGATDLSDSIQLSVAGGDTANLPISLTAPNVNSIAFVSASPETIYLKGSGYAEASVVTFEVRDEAGQPLPAQVVQLELTTFAGGLTMDGSTVMVEKPSDSNGRVSVRVNSGTVPTPVRVRATIKSNTNVTTVSSSLAIAVGLPSQLNFSLSQETINIEGMDIDGTPNTYNIIASDRLANPVPEGTTVSFVSEGGTVEPALQTALIGGLARVSARALSAEPRPADGRVTVLAYALGEESFLDVNGDNVFNAGEAFQDLGDVFLSRKYLANFDAVLDQYISLSLTGSAACAAIDATKDPLGLLTGTRSIPSKAASCDGAWGRAYVRRAVETVYSTSASRLLWGTSLPAAADDGCRRVTIPTGNSADSLANVSYYAVGGERFYNLGIGGALSFIVADANLNRLNPMPRGTVISVTASDGITVSVAGGSPVANTSQATTAAVNYKFDTASSGAITISTRSPGGLVTSYTIGVFTGAVPGGVTPCGI